MKVFQTVNRHRCSPTLGFVVHFPPICPEKMGRNSGSRRSFSVAIPYDSGHQPTTQATRGSSNASPYNVHTGGVGGASFEAHRLIPEAAAVYGVGQSALKSAIRRGELELPVISIGARRVIPTAALKRLLGLVDAA